MGRTPSSQEVELGEWNFSPKAKAADEFKGQTLMDPAGEWAQVAGRAR